VPFPPHPKYCFCALCQEEINLNTGIPDFILLPDAPVKCECGADKAKDGGPHSTWCPKAEVARP